MKWMIGAALLSFGCAEVYPIPTQDMAKATMELHVAEQQGARYSPEGAHLCQLAEAAIEQSRRSVFRGERREAHVAALESYEYAREAHELTKGTPAAAARESQQPPRTVATTAATVAWTNPDVQ
jgi:hypothetical protein